MSDALPLVHPPKKCQCSEPRLIEARLATLDQVAGKLAAAEYYCDACEWRRTEPLHVESRPA